MLRNAHALVANQISQGNAVEHGGDGIGNGIPNGISCICRIFHHLKRAIDVGDHGGEGDGIRSLA